MRIWLDLANSPHVLFFRPVIAQLRSRGHAVLITARDFAQTLPLCRSFGIDAVPIGSHGGGNLLARGANIAGRALALARFARRTGPARAACLGSYAQILSARLCGIGCVTFMDFEGQPANHLSFRLASRVVVPECFPAAALRVQGASPRRTVRLPGVKEQVYIERPPPPLEFLECRTLGDDPRPVRWTRDDGRILAVVRPPASMSLYYRENRLFPQVIARLTARADVLTLVVARTAEQRREMAGLDPSGRIVEPVEVPDGLLLLGAADLVVSGGGTMNREGAVLGTPAYSVFSGEPIAVDRWLEAQGRLALLRNEADLDRLKIEAKPPPRLLTHPGLLDQVVAAILRPMGGRG